MAELNYHHLRYFRAVARTGHLTRAAEALNLSQSALSAQIRQLEARLGHALFERRGRQLHLTEAGRIALDHADVIFAAGDDLLATLQQTGASHRLVRIGALATLSRNFQIDFLRPLVGSGVQIELRSGTLGDLLSAVATLQLDLALLDVPPPPDAEAPFLVHKVAEEVVSLIGDPALVGTASALEDLIAKPLILPPRNSPVRVAFDALAARLKIDLSISAEVDDMAMMRLLAREGAGVAVIPPIVVKDELQAGRLIEAAKLTDISEVFYAVTLRRRFPNTHAEALFHM